ncbi:MAG: hypothetical protein Q8P59_08485 [Dehalococcoidia bacterium]|nr:hypothetical protein [Dehalococcoidia bacterium]
MDEDEKARLTKHYQELYDEASLGVDRVLGIGQPHLVDEAMQEVVEILGKAQDLGLVVGYRELEGPPPDPSRVAWLKAKYEDLYEGTLEDFKKTQIS